MTFEDFLDLTGAVKRGSRWLAKCPAHADSRPSLDIREGDDGRILLHCRAGCRTYDVVEALNLTWKDLFPDGEYAVSTERSQARAIATAIIERMAQDRRVVPPHPPQVAPDPEG